MESQTRTAPPLPDFCSLPVLLTLLLVAALVALILLLAPGVIGLREFSLTMLFALWLATLCGVGLCKFRPWLERLPQAWPYAAAWGLLALIVAAASAVVWWLDHALLTSLIPARAAQFVGVSVALAVIIGAALMRYLYVLTQWQTRLAAVTQAQVEALQARIRPHFLFNSMNTAAALVRVDAPAAERTLENLAELFRAALGHDRAMSTLGEELELIERYLAIEQLRLGERLRIERSLDGLPHALPLPPLLLQPLVENAVYHGIQPRREGGVVSLRGTCRNHAVIIEIGNPLSAATTPPGFGHALENVRRRIGYHFGERGALEVERAAESFLVRVRLPDESPDRR